MENGWNLSFFGSSRLPSARFVISPVRNAVSKTVAKLSWRLGTASRLKRVFAGRDTHSKGNDLTMIVITRPAAVKTLGFCMESCRESGCVIADARKILYNRGTRRSMYLHTSASPRVTLNCKVSPSVVKIACAYAALISGSSFLDPLILTRSNLVSSRIVNVSKSEGCVQSAVRDINARKY